MQQKAMGFLTNSNRVFPTEVVKKPTGKMA
jgi:hypothetical protein